MVARCVVAVGLYVVGILFAAQSARADETRAAFCAAVQRAVKEAGADEVERRARLAGVSAAKIAQAKLCLSRKS